jgi:hypothetical protein
MSSEFTKKLNEMADVYLRKRPSVDNVTKGTAPSFLEVVKEAGGVGGFVDNLRQRYDSGGVGGVAGSLSAPVAKYIRKNKTTGIQRQMDPKLVQVYSNQWLRMAKEQQAFFNNDVNNYVDYRLSTNTNANPQQLNQPAQPNQRAQPAQPAQPVQPGSQNSVLAY